MKCQRCRQNEATIHLLELVDGVHRSTWMCADCAGGDRNQERPEPDEEFGPETPEQGESESLASFLGGVLDPQPEMPADPPSCPDCGYTLEDFRRTNRLGCPRCYEVFRGNLLPLLARFHRHVSHLGRVPDRHHGAESLHGQLTRYRVALEKAIATEDFEEAARLRDLIRNLDRKDGPA